MNQFEFLIPIAFFVIVAVIFKIVTENRTRQKLIDKGMLDERTKYLFMHPAPPSLNSLKWGMVLIAVGLALALVNLFPIAFEGPASIGLMMLFAGTAFILYFIIARKHEEKDAQ